MYTLIFVIRSRNTHGRRTYSVRRLKFLDNSAGIIISVVAFVWISRRVAKRVEAVTQATQQEMAKAQNIAQNFFMRGKQREGTEVLHRAIDAAVATLRTGLLFRK